MKKRLQVRCIRKGYLRLLFLNLKIMANKIIYVFASKIALLSMLALAVCSSCSARPGSGGLSIDKKGSLFSDSIIREAVGDSIVSIMAGAKKIKASVLVVKGDTVLACSEVTIKAKYESLVQFVVSDPQMYKSDLAVFGSFIPCFQLLFSKSKERCLARFDFGLGKWAIYNDEGRMLKRYDLSSNEMLRLANMLFPENGLYNSQVKYQK